MNQHQNNNLDLFRAPASSRAISRQVKAGGIGIPRNPKIAVLLSALVGVVLLILSLPPARPAYIWNFSPSLTEGLYRLEDRPWRRGDLIALRSDGRVRKILNQFGTLRRDRLLLKRIAAVAGDVVCREHDVVSINGTRAALARRVTRDGQHLPVWSGCSVLSSDTIFLLGDHPDSFDGRYFGPVSAPNIAGVISPILTFPTEGVSPK